MTHDPVLQGLKPPLLAIVILRVSVLYEGTKWVGNGLWILSTIVYAITITLAVITIKSLYSQFFPLESTKRCLQQVYRELYLRSDVRGVLADRHVLQNLWHIYHTVTTRQYYHNLYGNQDISSGD